MGSPQTSSVLLFRQVDGQAFMRAVENDLTGQPGGFFRFSGEANHVALHVARGRKTVEPGAFNVNMAGAAGTKAAAVGVDPLDVIADGCLHEALTGFGLDSGL